MTDEGPDAKTANYTTLAADHNKVIECSGTFTVLLLDASTGTKGYRVIVKNNGTGIVTVDTDTAGDEIDEEASIQLGPKQVGIYVVNAAADGYYRQSVISQILDRDVTQNEVVNTGTETTIYTFSVPANALGKNGMLRLTLLADYLNDSGGSSAYSFNVKFGTSTLGFAHGSITTQANRRASLLECWITAKNATNAQIMVGRASLGGDIGEGSSATAVSNIVGKRNDAAQDTTAAVTLEVTVQHGTVNASISTKIETVHLELLA